MQDATMQNCLVDTLGLSRLWQVVIFNLLLINLLLCCVLLRESHTPVAGLT